MPSRIFCLRMSLSENRCPLFRDMRQSVELSGGRFRIGAAIAEREETMAFRVSGKNIDVGEALRARISERIDELLTRYFDRGYSGQVTVSKSGHIFETELALHLDSGVVLEVHGSNADANLSFDQAAERLAKRLRRYKRRLADH